MAVKIINFAYSCGAEGMPQRVGKGVMMPVCYMMAGMVCGGLAAVSSFVMGHPLLFVVLTYSLFGSLTILAMALGLPRDLTRRN